jgi:hypothetical protein
MKKSLIILLTALFLASTSGFAEIGHINDYYDDPDYNGDQTQEDTSWNRLWLRGAVVIAGVLFFLGVENPDAVNLPRNAWEI